MERPKEEREPVAELRRAAAHVQAGQWRAADRCCRALVAAQPELGPAWHLWGSVAYADGELGEAVERFRRASSLCPDEPTAWGNLGTALRAAGQLAPAIAAYHRALELVPAAAELWYNLGSAERAAGRAVAAIAAYRQALELCPSWSAGWNNLALALCDDGRVDEAVAALSRALSLSPQAAAIHSNMGNALRQALRHDEAGVSYRRALELRPDCASAAFNLHALLYRDDHLAPAAAALEQALSAEPEHLLARFFLGVIRDQQGRASCAERHFSRLRRCAVPPEHLLDSWSYARGRRGSGTRFFALGPDLLTFALVQAKLEGLVLEFGVRRGASLRHIAAKAGQPVHGFDSLRGLPEPWGEHPVGAYSTAGEPPELGPGAELHVGWFHDSLPPFLRDQPGPVRFANVDCDLYSSTCTVLDHIGGRIVAGSVLVFDEYLCNPGWQREEFRAFQRAARARRWRYEYLAFSLFSRQAAVRIVAVD